MKLKYTIFLLVIAISSIVSAAPPSCEEFSTSVPGHCKADEPHHTQGRYNSVYAYDDNGSYYWDLGDGRIYTSSGITSIDDLVAETLTVCDYVVTYGGGFGDDPFLDYGWIQNHINCSGYDGNLQYNFLIVHRSDPRFDENNLSPGWGPDWRYTVQTIQGQGNVAAGPNENAGP